MRLQRIYPSLAGWLPAAAAVLFLLPPAKAQCLSPYTTELHGPVGMVLADSGDLLVSESGLVNGAGVPVPNTGIISIVNRGGRRTLLSGLPSGINDQGGVSGPAGLFLLGQTLYVAISAGDAAVAGALPGSIVANPAPSSPLFSSVLALHFSSSVESFTSGFTMTIADQQALARRSKVTLSNLGGDRMTIELVANFPDFVPGVDPTVAHSNPFGLVAVGNRLYVTDGGENSLWQVDLSNGSFTTLTQFTSVANPFYPGLGGPREDAVPTAIVYSEGRLLVALFRGVPFAPGTSSVVQVDPVTGSQSEFITGLTSAIGILPVRTRSSLNYLVLQFASVGPFFGGPGQVLRFAAPSLPGTLVTDCLSAPTAMALDEKTAMLYVTELGGKLIPVAVVP
jgi:hypothetical protein